MTFEKRRRATGAMAAALAGLVFAARSDVAFAQAPAEATKPEATNQSQRFTGTTVNLAPGAGEAVTIHILRWSSDADRNNLAAAFKDKGDAGLQAAIEAAPTLGIIWTGETLGYSIHYAHRIPLPDGGERVIVASERRLGAWSRGNLWKAAGQQAMPDYPFTVIELRMNRRGQGEGKMSLATKVTFEPEAKTIALENYASVPVLIKDVRRVPVAGATTN